MAWEGAQKSHEPDMWGFHLGWGSHMFKAHMKPEREEIWVPSPGYTYPCPALPQNNWFWKRFCLVPRWNGSGVSRSFSSSLKNTSHQEQASTNSKRGSCPCNTSSPHYPQGSQQHPPILRRLKIAKKGIYLKVFI